MGPHEPTPPGEVAELIRSRPLRYPIASKDEFVAQMRAPGTPVVFRGVPYDPEYGASLVPDFFFPIGSESELIGKVTELIAARGLIALPQHLR